MEEVKLCPYCGGEIKSSAKKCKHCGQWLEKQCPQCGEWVKAEAKKCRFCGYWFDSWERRKQEKTEEEKIQSIKDAVSSVKERDDDDDNDEEGTSWLLQIENLIIIFLIGFSLNLDWWGYIIVGIILYVLMSIHVIRFFYCIGVSLLWGIIGIGLAPYILSESDSDIAGRLLTDNFTAYWWIGLIAVIVSLVLHSSDFKSKS